MKKFFKITKIVILLTCITVLFIGCNNTEIKDTSTKSRVEQKVKDDVIESDEDGEQEEEVEEKIELPALELEDKKITYFWWEDVKSQRAKEGENPTAIDFFEQEYGGEIDTIVATHGDYWQKLATLVSSGDSPDFIYMSNWSWFPQAMTSNLVECAEDYIDFNNPLWKEVEETNEQYKWKDKIYTPVIYDYICEWLYYNKSLFEAYGLDTPKDYYERNEWTWNKLKELAVELTEDTDGDGEIDQWGFAPHANPFIYTCGLPVVETTSDGYFKHNLKDPKIAAAMNMYYELGEANLNVIGGHTGGMKTGKLAMYAFASWGHAEDFRDAWDRGEIEIAPLPIPTKDSQYVVPVKVQAHGIGNGCKNPKAAALLIELYRYQYSEAYRDKYNYHFVNRPGKIDINADLLMSPDLTDEQKEYHEQLFNLPKITTAWESWYYYGDITADRLIKGEPWSKVVEEIYPKNQKSLEDYFKNIE